MKSEFDKRMDKIVNFYDDLSSEELRSLLKSNRISHELRRSIKVRISILSISELISTICIIGIGSLLVKELIRNDIK